MPEAGGKGGVHQQRGSAGASESGQAGGPNELIYFDKFVTNQWHPNASGRARRRLLAGASKRLPRRRGGSLFSSTVQTKASAVAQANCWLRYWPIPSTACCPSGKSLQKAGTRESSRATPP